MVLPVKLSERLQQWLDRVEIVARGGELLRRDALDALEQGRPWEARSLALRLLEEVPDSPSALLVWADAAEAMFLDHEVEPALARLAELVPYRAEVWVRLARVRLRLGADARVAFERAANAEAPREFVFEALTWLLQAAIDARDLTEVLAIVARARREPGLPPALRLRVAEALLVLEDTRAARRFAAGVAIDATDARGWFIEGRLALSEQQHSRAEFAWRRALLLGDAALGRRLGELLAEVRDRRLFDHLYPLARDLGLADLPEWQIAQGLSDGDPERVLGMVEARARDAPGPTVLGSWIEVALLARNAPSLRRALSVPAGDDSGSERVRDLADARQIALALDAEDRVRLELLDSVTGIGRAWASELRAAVYARWISRGGEAGWRAVLEEVEELAKARLSLPTLAEVAALRLDFDQPLRVVVIGEFNAGKSSLINALLGQTVAPVGILPTTATINRLRWAPDHFVRVDFLDPARVPRILEYAAVSDYLKREPVDGISSVSIFSPLEPLRQLEVVDTPGFNAGQADHQTVALRAAQRAHVLIWLVDASSPLKSSEAKQVAALREIKVPTCVVVNKCDRFTDPEVEAILRHVREGLESMNLEPWTEPIAFSAKLAGPGAAGAGERGLQALQDLFQSLLDHALELKARVLAQRTVALLDALERDSGESGGQRQQQAAAAAEQQLQARRDALLAEWARAIAPELARMGREFAFVLGTDADVRRYAANRVGDALGQRLCSLVSMNLGDARLREAIRPALAIRLGALSRGMSLSFRGGNTDVALASPEDMAQLAHHEVVHLLREIAQGGGTQAPNPTRSSVDEAAGLARLRALREALLVTSWTHSPVHTGVESKPGAARQTC